MLRPATPFAKYVRHPIEALGAVFLWGIFRILPLDWASGLGGAVAAWIGPKLKIEEQRQMRA